MRYTVDASVIARWLIRGERWEEEAESLMEDYMEGRVELYAPSLILYECLNALWKSLRIGVMEREEALQISRELPKFLPETLNLTAQDAERIMELSIRLGLTCYDCSYIAVSMKTGTPLITADEELYRKAGEVISTLHIKDYH